MRRHLAFRVLFAASIASGVATACLYEVPDVQPFLEGGLGRDVFIPQPDQTVPRPDAPPPIDSGLDAGCTLRCATTAIANRPSARTNAMAIDRATSTAYLAIESAPSSNIASLALDGAPKTLTNLNIAAIPGSVTGVTPPTPAGQVVFLNAGALSALEVATSTIVPFGGLDAGAVTATALGAELDVTNQQVFVQQSSPLRIARVSYADGTQTLVDTLTLSSTRAPTFFGGAIYWFEGSGTLLQLQRAPAAGGGSNSGSSLLPISSVNQGEGLFASSSAIVTLVANSATAGSTVVNLTAPPRLLAIPGAGAALLPAWIEASATGVVKMLTPAGTTSTTVVPNPETAGAQLNVSFLFFSGTQLYAIGNTATATYVVYLHD